MYSLGLFLAGLSIPHSQGYFFNTCQKNIVHNMRYYGRNEVGKGFLTYFEVRFEVFTSGDYEDCCLLGCYAMWLLQEPIQKTVMPPSSEWQESVN
jgi:hypothetical protein